MVTLKHPDLPRQKFTCDDMSAPHWMARGWVETEPDPVLTAADIEAAAAKRRPKTKEQ